MAKICTRCGRQLADGEICTCGTRAVQQNMNYQNRVASPGGRPAQPSANQQNGRAAQPGYGQQNGRPANQQGNRAAQPVVNQAGYNQQNGRAAQPGYGQQNQPGYGQQNQPGYYQPGGQSNQPEMNNEAVWLHQQKNMIVSRTKNMFSEILPILKAPVSRGRAIAATNSIAVGTEFIIAKTIVCILLFLLAAFKVKSEMNSYGYGIGGLMQNYVKIPYLEIIFCILVLTVGFDFLKASLMKACSTLFKETMTFAGAVTVIGVKTMYQAIIFFAGGVIALLLPIVGAIILSVGLLLTPWIEYAGYHAIVYGSEDKKPYAYFVIQLVVYIVDMLICSIIVWSALAEMLDMLGMLF